MAKQVTRVPFRVLKGFARTGAHGEASRGARMRFFGAEMHGKSVCIKDARKRGVRIYIDPGEELWIRKNSMVVFEAPDPLQEIKEWINGDIGKLFWMHRHPVPVNFVTVPGLHTIKIDGPVGTMQIPEGALVSPVLAGCLHVVLRKQDAAWHVVGIVINVEKSGISFAPGQPGKNLPRSQRYAVINNARRGLAETLYSFLRPFVSSKQVPAEAVFV